MSALQLWQMFERRSGEWRWCLRGNQWVAQRALLGFFGMVSRLGDGVFWYTLMLALALYGGRGLLAALHMGLTGIVAALLYRYLKRWTRRPRPYRAHPRIVVHVAPLDEFSFPSGHTLHATVFTLIALAWFPLLAPIVVPFAILVAMSRVVLGLHYPSDVLAAIVIGCALAYSSSWVVRIVA